MKKVLKNIIALLCVISMLGSLAAFAADEAHIVYTRDDNNVIATATVTSDGGEKILVVSSYKDGLLKEIKTDRMYVSGTETLSATIKAGVDEVVANVIDGFGGKTVSSKAVYAADSINVRGIKINGKEIKDFSNEVNEYTLQCDSGEVDIEVILEDATTKVEIADNYSPGNAKITLTSSRGRKKSILLNLYDTEDKTYTLSSLKYLIGDEEYEIEGFSPNTYNYNVELPDNTMSVRLVPESVGQIKTYLTDTAVSSVNGVEIGKLYDIAAEAYIYKRNSLNNLVPVKNEIATAEIVVSNGKEGKNQKESVYQIEFTAKQPRLTEFNMTGCADDSIKPAFIGGSAANNDNGSIITSQNGWTASNITDALLGGSMFLFADVRKSNWWLSHTEGDYFNFTADTPGTIYVISGNKFDNNSEYTDDGWTKLPGTSFSNFPEWGVNLRQIRKDYNDWDVDYFMNCMYYNSANSKDKRALNPGIAQTTVFDDAGVTNAGMVNGYKKTFEAGENVSVYNSGKEDWNAASICAIIKWDDEYVTYAPDFEEETETEGGEEELLPELPSLKIIDPNLILEVMFSGKTDITSDIWTDESGKENNITLDPAVGQWTDNGYKVTSGKGEIELPDVAADALDSQNCTIVFELGEVSVDEGSDGIVLLSQNGERFIISSATQVQMMGWSTTLQRPKFDYSLLAGKKHTIVFDGEKSKIHWYIEGEDAPITKTMKAPSNSIASLAFGTGDAAYSGSVTFKSFKIYDKVLTEEEIMGGEAE